MPISVRCAGPNRSSPSLARGARSAWLAILLGTGWACGGSNAASDAGSGNAGSGTGGENAASSGGKTGAAGSSASGGGNTGSGGVGVGTTGTGGAGGMKSASGGKSGTGGKAGSGGKSGSGGSGGGSTGGGGGKFGSAGSGGSGGAAGAPVTASLCNWPTATAEQKVAVTIVVAGTMDGGMKRFIGDGPLGTATQSETQGPLFDLQDGAVLQNVILGNPAADGVHCNGTCTLKNVWWEDVGEDAATLKGTLATQVMTIDGGGATKATDKVFQHNGPGTMIIENFCAQDFGKLYRSCGNCSTQHERHVQMKNILVIPRPTSSALAGLNANYNDSGTFQGIVIKAKLNDLDICTRYTGNNTGAEPPKLGNGPDAKVCLYVPSDITWTP